MSNQEKDKKISLEIIRFTITGVICAVLDFITMYLIAMVLKNTGMNETLVTALSTLAGFIVGVIANYILSTIWVFKNVKDKNKSKTPLFIILFVILSAIGWGLSFGTMELCRISCNAWWGIEITPDSISFSSLATAEFWLYAVAFGLKTLIGMVWNYLTRKFILYKAPKEEKNIENEDVEEEVDGEEHE